MKHRQFRFANLVILAAYIDGWVDAFRGEGKILDDETYLLAYIDQGQDIRVVAISERQKTDYESLPVTVIAKDKLQEGELEQMSEIRLSGQSSAN